MIIQILVAEGERVDTLPHERRDGVLHARGIAIIVRAGSELRKNPCGALHLAQQHRAPV